jgi:hypothetical protein
MEHMLTKMKEQLGVKTDPEIPAESLKELCNQFKAFYKDNKGEDFPQDPYTQLWGAIMAVFNSWEAEKAVTYRRVEKITDLKGTAVNMSRWSWQQGPGSGTRVLLPRPNRGANDSTAITSLTTQGVEVVAASTPSSCHARRADARGLFPASAVRAILESTTRKSGPRIHHRGRHAIMLQCRTGSAPPRRFLHRLDQGHQPLLSTAQAYTLMKKSTPKQWAPGHQAGNHQGEAVKRIDPKTSRRCSTDHRTTRRSASATHEARIAGASTPSGRAAGKVVCTAAEAREMAAAGARHPRPKVTSPKTSAA